MPLATSYFDCSYSEGRKRICMLGNVDDLDPDEAYTLAVMLDAKGWTSAPLKDLAATSLYYGDTHTWTIGRDGEIWTILGGNFTRERLPDSGSHGRALGQPNQIRKIGDRLYVCGFAGQVYTQDAKGKWIHMDDGLAEKVGTPGSIDLEDIGGTGAD